MITTDDAQVAERAKMIRNHGMRQRYRHEILGYNFRMTEIQAAIGLVQLKRLPQWTAQRIENAAYLTRHLDALEKVVTPKVKDGCVHVFHQYTVRVREGRDAAVERLQEEGIGVGIYYPIPVHKQPLYQKLGYWDRLPRAERASREVASLPIRPGLSGQDLARIVEGVKNL